MKLKLAILGCGNMAQAIFSGFVSSDETNNDFEFFCYTPSGERAKSLAKSLNGTWISKLEDLPLCDIYFLGMKPQQLSEAVAKLSIPRNSTVVSVLAAVEKEKLSSLLKTDKVLRVMPNTPSFFGAGVSLVSATEKLNLEVLLKQKLLGIFATVSTVIELESDEQIDRVTGVSGSGPAYLFEYARLMQEALEEQGLSTELARLIVQKTFLGSSIQLDRSKDSFLELRKKVTSKGGVTEQALMAMERFHFSTMVKEQLKAAYQRIKELKN